MTATPQPPLTAGTRYRHYKGGLYEIVCTAILEADPSVTLVIYKPLYNNPEGHIWARPTTVFFETVAVAGQSVPRFSYVA